MGLHPLEHKVWKVLKPLELQNSKLILAVSGGVDSMVLLEVFCSLKGLSKLDFSVCYIHHGLLGQDLPNYLETNTYRSSALDFVKQLSAKKEISFLTNQQPAIEKPQSEESLRFIRQNYFASELKDSVVVLGHHSDDLLETQMIRLVRGTGVSGLESMQLYSGKYLRPFLGISKKEILEYAKEKNLEFIEDPSNKKDSYLRNWMRNTWLPQLEEKREGSLGSLAKSLGQIVVNESTENIWSQFIESGGLNRARLMSLPVGLRSHCMAHYLTYLGSKSHNSNQISEILKRIDNNQKEHKFEAVELSWKVTEKLISADKIW